MERMLTFAPQTWLRAEPKTSAELLATMPPGTEVEVLGEANRYARVKLTDCEGQLLEGYVASSFLQPIAQEKPETPADSSVKADEGRKLLLHNLDGATRWLAAGLVFLFITNLVTTYVLWRNIRDLDNRPVNVSCSGHGYSAPTYTWGSYASQTVDPDYYQDGKVRVLLDYQVQEKLPGSKLILRYRLQGEETWKEKVMQEGVRPLLFSSSVVVIPTAVVDYQVLQKLNGETVRADHDARADLTWFVGTGDVVWGLQPHNNGTVDVFFRQEPMPQVTALQIEEVVVRVQQKNPIELRLSNLQAWEYWQFKESFTDEGFTGMTVTVHYRDGEERTVEVGKVVPYPQVIKR